MASADMVRREEVVGGEEDLGENSHLEHVDQRSLNGNKKHLPKRKAQSEKQCTTLEPESTRSFRREKREREREKRKQEQWQSSATKLLTPTKSKGENRRDNDGDDRMEAAPNEKCVYIPTGNDHCDHTRDASQ